MPETRPSLRFLTELIHIISIDKYQHQTNFFSSQPAIKIHTSQSSSSSNSSLQRDNHISLLSKSSSLEKDSKSISISFFFKNNHIQELLYTVLLELWSGLKISHEQCDTAVLNAASRHIALIDTLSNFDFEEETLSSNNRQIINPRHKSRQERKEVIIYLFLFLLYFKIVFFS